MIDPEDKLSVQRQARLLKISRSSVYYKPHPFSEDELNLMRTIDELHLAVVPVVRTVFPGS